MGEVLQLYDSMKVRLEEPTLGLKIAMQLFQSVKHLLKDSLIIQEENKNKNHKRVVSLYVIKNHVNLHKL